MLFTHDKPPSVFFREGFAPASLIRVVLVYGERNILAVRGSVPGAKGTVVIIKEHHR